MAAFADSLLPAATAPVPGLSIADALSSFFGGDPTGAYLKGQDAGAQYKLRTAQTESALAEADQRRAEALRKTQISDLVTKAQSDPNYTPSVSDLLTIATGAGDLTKGQLNQQELGNRTTLTDPNASPETQFLAGQGVKGEVLPHMYAVGGETVNQAVNPNATFETPAQQVDVAATKALEGERNRSPVGANGGVKAPAGYRLSADGQSLEFIPGGPHDPEAPTAQSAREAIYTNRVLGGAAQAVAAMGNIMRMPVGASTGFLGVGKAPGKGIFESARGSLMNAVAPDEVQQYSVALSGLSRNLASIETQGLAPPGSFTGSLDTLQLREGDTEMTKLLKLAEVRQTVEAGLDPLLNSPRVPPQTKEYAQKLIASLQHTIPFTWADVQTLQGQPAGSTLGELLKKQGGVPATPVQPAVAASADPRVKQYADQYLGGDVAKATAILRQRGAIP